MQRELVGFREVTTVTVLSCLTWLSQLVLLRFPSNDSFAPLQGLTKTRYLALSISSSCSISLEPLSELALLASKALTGDKEGEADDR
jgi:hypothetical protein